MFFVQKGVRSQEGRALLLNSIRRNFVGATVDIKMNNVHPSIEVLDHHDKIYEVCCSCSKIRMMRNMYAIVSGGQFFHFGPLVVSTFLSSFLSSWVDNPPNTYLKMPIP